LTLIALAMLLGVGALVLGGWAFARQHRSTGPSKPVPVATRTPLPRAVALLASPRSERLPLARSAGRLVAVLDRRGSALLVVRNLGHAPVGRTYQVWVITPGAKPAPAASFAGGAEQVVWLRGRVEHGARIAVTLERATGASAPTRPLRLVVRRT
jgi:anti-sigma-K factor RskA